MGRRPRTGARTGNADVPNKAFVLHLPEFCKRVEDRLITRPVDNRLLTRRNPVRLSLGTQSTRMVAFLARTDPSRHEFCVMQVYYVEIVSM